MMHRFLLTLILTFSAGFAVADIVKQSNSGICHDTASPWYDRTKDFAAHETMAACLAEGRAYSGYDGPAESRPADVPQEYDRTLYGRWIDVDGDCQNQRHELLLSLSTGPVTLSPDGCRAAHGRWNDPYTGRIFTESRDMDIDHMVPLAWAHEHGAHAWDAETRERFANDPVNLFAVKAGVNRSKGARGPLEWLPPNASFHCQYVTRFHRIVLTYKLNYAPEEREQMDLLRAQLCQ
jgi:hypothetical protein